ncbi:hypothetical protein BC941DRAFT_449754 [Chlamydoabsidia padenii]|nr:hypothetical protein BC941DRAFT_449754 [Chlamydoabsidia padenii]
MSIAFTLLQIITVFMSSLCYGMQLRKHDQQILEPSEGETVLTAAQFDTDATTKHHTNTTKGCGEGTMTCLTFASDNTNLPVKCGTLTNVPLCLTTDQQGEEECTVFCDSDGHSTNGCVSSQPINVRLHQKE